jgi:hypothetical protein
MNNNILSKTKNMILKGKYHIKRRDCFEIFSNIFPQKFGDFLGRLSLG